MRSITTMSAKTLTLICFLFLMFGCSKGQGDDRSGTGQTEPLMLNSSSETFESGGVCCRSSRTISLELYTKGVHEELEILEINGVAMNSLPINLPSLLRDTLSLNLIWARDEINDYSGQSFNIRNRKFKTFTEIILSETDEQRRKPKAEVEPYERMFEWPIRIKYSENGQIYELEHAKPDTTYEYAYP